MAEQDIEQRYAALVAAAKDIGCEVSISLTIGGVKQDEVYRIFRTSDPDASLDEQLAIIEAAVADPLHQAAAEATRRMVEAESVGALVADMVQARQAEYRDVARALRTLNEKGERPQDHDNVQRVITDIATFERGRPMSEVLADILRGVGREPTAPDPVANEAQPEQEQGDHA